MTLFEFALTATLLAVLACWIDSAVKAKRKRDNERKLYAIMHGKDRKLRDL